MRATILLQQSRLSADLEQGLMNTRLLPFTGLVPRFERIIRQVNTELGKQASLTVHGADREIDRTILDRIVAPIEHIVRNAIDSENKNVNNIKESERHFFLIGGYVMNINPNLKFKPSFLAKYVNGAPMSFDLTAAVMIKERIVAGLAMREGDSFGGVLQLRVAQQLWFGYAYDYTTSRLNGYNSGTHEVMVSFDMGLSKNNVVKSPRFF